MNKLFSFALALATVIALPAIAEEAGDPYEGEYVYQVCAPCHGAEGEGGGGGNYPRLAGMSIGYLAEQLEAFKRRERINIPMYPFTEERELSAQDILDVSTYISAMKLSNRMPEMAEDTDGYARLLAAKRVLQIPREDGNLENGKKFYDGACANCHGEKGEGKKFEPLLAGQHIKYLRHQIDEMQKDKRYHPKPNRYITPLTPVLIGDILAYISTLDD